MTKIDINKALLDPTSVFNNPKEVYDCKDITQNIKIDILKRWQYDCLELEAADDENMTSTGQSDILDEVLHYLDLLDN